MEKNKLKLIFLLQVLRNTDEQHPMTARQLASHLASYGIEAAPATISQDITSLRDAGYEILSHHNKRKGYFFLSHTLEDYECKILCDMVSAASFLTEKDSRRLLGKLIELASPTAHKLINNELFIDARFKSDNSQFKIAFDGALRAVGEKRKISFYYRDPQDPDNAPRKGEDGAPRLYTVTPLYVVYHVADYYLLALMPQKEALTVFRIDRMTGVSLLDDPAEKRQRAEELQDLFNLNRYVQKSVDMYGGEKIFIRLRCKPGARALLRRRFGADIPMRNTEDGYFLTQFDCLESDALYRFLLSHSDEIIVVFPDYARAEIRKRLQNALDAY